MRHTFRTGIAVLVVALFPAMSEAQSDARAGDAEQRRPDTASGTAPVIGSTLPADVVRDLPLTDNVYAALETIEPEVIADRFNNGGLNVAQDSRVGGLLGSPSQTLFRVGDINVSDPSGSGASLLFPSLLFWDRIDVTTGLMPIDMNTPGLAVTLQPLRPGSSWSTAIAGVGSGGSLVANAPGGQPPPIVRLRDYANGSVLVSGPLSPTVGLTSAGTLTRGTHDTREALPGTRDTLASAFAHLVFAPSNEREIRVLAWVQHRASPFGDWQSFNQPTDTTDTTAFHGQATVEHRGSSPWRIFGGFTQRTSDNDLGTSAAGGDVTRATVDRITVGPVPDLAARAADTTARRASIGGRLNPSSGGDTHRFELGVDTELASLDSSSQFTGNIDEVIDGSVARVWTYSAPAATDHRATAAVSAFARDEIALSRALTLDAGIRLDAVHGAADHAATSITWISALPHASLRVALGANRDLRFGYTRSANTLTLNWLAFGDPGAPTGTLANPSAPNVVVARVGPGTGGNGSFSSIDPDLKRPTTDEFVIGYERRRGTATRYTLTGIVRRETNMLAVVNTGVPVTGYSTITIQDPGSDWASTADDRPLTVYNRLPVTFGQDAYLLTNPVQQAATGFALRMTWEHRSDRWFMLFGATASAATGQGGNRGYGPLENDQDQPGELFTDPNAATYARGRLFTDRAFTIKWSGSYRLPAGFTVGAIARYHDGQPFSRIVVVPGLSQGTEAVQAYPNGDSRFTFTGTLDLRVQKRFTVGAAHLDAIFDAYDLFTRSNEVEESVISDPILFRTPTAIEPPPSIHLGVRVTF
jgi:hypothetical protein